MADDDALEGEPEEPLDTPGPRRSTFTPPEPSADAVEAASNIFDDDDIAAAMSAEFERNTTGAIHVIPQGLGATPPAEPEYRLDDFPAQPAPTAALPVSEPDPEPQRPLYFGAPAPTVPPVDAPPPPGYSYPSYSTPVAFPPAEFAEGDEVDVPDVATPMYSVEPDGSDEFPTAAQPVYSIDSEYSIDAVDAVEPIEQFQQVDLGEPEVSPVYTSHPDPDLLKSLEEEGIKPGGTLELIEQLEAQLRLRSQDAEQFQPWEGTTLAAQEPDVATPGTQAHDEPQHDEPQHDEPRHDEPRHDEPPMQQSPLFPRFDDLVADAARWDPPADQPDFEDDERPADDGTVTYSLDEPTVDLFPTTQYEPELEPLPEPEAPYEPDPEFPLAFSSAPTPTAPVRTEPPALVEPPKPTPVMPDFLAPLGDIPGDGVPIDAEPRAPLEETSAQAPGIESAFSFDELLNGAPDEIADAPPSAYDDRAQAVGFPAVVPGARPLVQPLVQPEPPTDDGSSIAFMEPSTTQPESPAEQLTSPRAWVVEQTALEPTPTDQRVGRAARLFWLWFAANSSLVSLAFGGVLVALGINLRQAIIAAIAGIALSFLPLGLGTLAGKRSGQPTMVVSRATFGVVGNILPALIGLFSRLFWGAALLWILGAGVANILEGAKLTFGFSVENLTLMGMGAGFVIALVIAIFGYGLIARVQLVVSIISAILIAGFIVLTYHYVDIAKALTTPDGSWTLVITGAVLVFSFVGLAWANSSSDLARYQRVGTSGGTSMLWATFGMGLPSFVLIAYGSVLAASNPQIASALVANPLDTLGRMLPVWYPAPLIAGTALSIISAVVLSIYSGGFALQSAGISARRPVAVVIVGVLVAAIAAGLTLTVTDFAGLFRDFATTVAVPVAAWAGIFAAETMIRKRRFDSASLLRRGGVYADARWLNIIMLVFISIIGLGLTSATVSWLSWEGYVFTALGIPLDSALASTDLGVLVALVLGVFWPVIGGIPAIRAQESSTATPE
jgi:purine-cytosine permease-like protein